MPKTSAAHKPAASDMPDSIADHDSGLEDECREQEAWWVWTIQNPFVKIGHISEATSSSLRSSNQINQIMVIDN
ncbi:hypothetical protein FISHEDRAFT_74737 [Fistulina hepatica ATCC 64428]|uniref:Uncharacterized protein n=1 Tax=Fistulina hepatica ATCC 64428 TaxID=1128425 RepID=A0A0D7A9K9_9AGAR|nr:hypothetical protein FISHEDRAFT_77498 [Fistulina hepatica ATCC 64428]KIY47350.1 hypothetical protein FISHEDRAFT_74737 [Fistulina hepatica ATCC 64428]